jgi:16S rRNA (cytosine967-C5)-methyltransferase
MNPLPSLAHAGRSNARGVALAVLLECQKKEAFVQEVLDRHLREAVLFAADRRLATQLAYGVLRRRGALDALIKPLLGRPPDRVEAWLWDVLRLGAFQLALLNHIPAHAALFETVELTTSLGRPRAKGFVNGVLRALQSVLTDDFGTEPAADALPFEAGRYRRLSRPVLPDPAAHRVEYLASGFAWPAWLAERWLPRFGWEECLRLGFWFAGPAPLWLRVNALRCQREDLLTACRGANIQTAPGSFAHAVRLIEPAAIRDLPGYEQGWFSVQDESAMRVVEALAPAPGSLVLDLCAAPGGKTSHLAEMMQNQGRVIACDVDERRLTILKDSCRRLGIDIVESRLLHAEKNEKPPPGPFDAVLVDVPCSNTGVLGKRPEARWRLRPKDFDHLVPLQTKLLLQACERVKPGGTVVYSTCSIEPEENQNVVTAVLQGMPDVVLEAEAKQLPGRPADGGYWAKLRRQGRA